MKWSVDFFIIFVFFIAFFSFVLFFDVNKTYSFFDIDGTITGKVISEEDSLLNISDLRTFPNVDIGSSCIIERVSSSVNSVKIGDVVHFEVFGKNCDGYKVDFEIFEKDILFDDHIINLQSVFENGVASFDWKITDGVLILADESSEDSRLEIYSIVSLSSSPSYSKNLVSEKIYLFYGDDSSLSPSGGSGPESALCSSITRYGITWNFQTPVECGQFANGDWWVIGPVTITSTSPLQIPGRHGSWLNPSFRSGLSGQPYDDRLSNNDGPSYDATLRPTFPLTITASASLLSTESQTTPSTCGATYGWDAVNSITFSCTRGFVRDAAVLTILTQVPPANSFRPTYFGTDKTIRFNKNQLDYNRLGRLTPSSAPPSPLNISQIEKTFERVNVQTNYWRTEGVQPSLGASGYGGAFALDVSYIAILVNLNYTNAEKERLVVMLTQLGIDFYGAFNNRVNVNDSWFPNGGHGSGRLFPILFAGALLNDQGMSRIRFDNTDPGYFGDTGQTFAVTNYPVNTPPSVIPECSAGGVNCGYGGYTSADIGLPDWGWNHWDDPRGDNVIWTGNGYRICCTASSWVGYALAAHIMGITDLWNHDVYFPYMDRYMQIEGVTQFPDWRRWLDQLWVTHRSDYGRQWNPNDLCTENTQRNCQEQRGVCAGSRETCKFKNWWGCSAPTYSPTTYVTHNSNYQVIESTCDGLDNDCDGQVDEGCVPGSLPNSPSDLNVTPVSSIQLRLNWKDNSDNEMNFRVERRQLPSGSFNVLSTASNLPANTITFTDNGLPTSTSFEYRVLANNSVGVSGWSNLASNTTNQSAPLDFTISRSPTSGSVQRGNTVSTTVTATHTSGTSSAVTFTATNLSAGISALFNPTSCTPSSGNSCSSTLTLSASSSATLVSNQSIIITGTSGTVVRNVNYNLTVLSLPVCTNGQVRNCGEQRGVCLNSFETCTNNNWPGCNYNSISGYATVETGVELCRDGLDNDCDGTRDLVGDSGCPIPLYSRFNNNLTTNISNITDLTRVVDFSIGIPGLGRIQYLGQQVSLWRSVSGVYQALNLNNAIAIASNIVGVYSESYVELNQTARVTFYNLSYTQAPVPIIQTSSGNVTCPSTKCTPLSYSNGEFVMTAVGFSNYSTLNSTCGDNYCHVLSETCSSCASDCGTCGTGSGSSSSGSGSGSSSGSGTGGPPRRTNTLVTQCNDEVDNDGDGLVDYPSDTGCSNDNDNIELDETQLVDEDLEETETLTEDSPIDSQIRLVFWIIMSTLIVGIIIVMIVIVHSVRKHRRFKSLMGNRLIRKTGYN
ncbi:MAG: fibronectin type III domain-containing protein [Nanoarchaeota archaeon]